MYSVTASSRISSSLRCVPLSPTAVSNRLSRSGRSSSPPRCRATTRRTSASMTAAAFLIRARPGVGTQSGSSAPSPANSLPISIWAMSIARPIASESAGVSTPKIVRTAIFWVSADISRLTSTRWPSAQRSASSTAQSAIVVAYDLTCLGRTEGCTNERLRRQSRPRATSIPLPSTVRNAMPSFGWSKVRSVSVSNSPTRSGSAMKTQRLRPNRQRTMSPWPRRSSKKASGFLPNCGRLPTSGSPLGPGTNAWPRGWVSGAGPVCVDIEELRSLGRATADARLFEPHRTGWGQRSTRATTGVAGIRQAPCGESASGKVAGSVLPGRGTTTTWCSSSYTTLPGSADSSRSHGTPCAASRAR